MLAAFDRLLTVLGQPGHLRIRHRLDDAAEHLTAWDSSYFYPLPALSMLLAVFFGPAFGIVAGIMLGLGETENEITETMDDARSVGVEVFTIGQYLQPTPRHLSVKEFLTPEQFEKYRIIGLEKGFRNVESSPLVRSSYHAEKHVH